MGRSGYVTEIQMPSSPAECSRLRKVVTRLASAMLRPSAAEEMELALGEALANAIRYGESGGKITIRVEARPHHEVAVELAYPDKPFDTSITCPQDLRNATGGFGRFIMKQSTDSMDYTFRNGYTHLRMTKRC